MKTFRGATGMENNKKHNAASLEIWPVAEHHSGLKETVINTTNDKK